MKFEEITRLLGILKSGSPNVTENKLREIIYFSEEIGDLTYFQTKDLLKELKGIDVNKLTMFDNYKTGIDDLLGNYYKDYSETNYINYDLDKTLERDMILEIVEKVDLEKSFTEKEALKYVAFLEDILKEHLGYRVDNSVQYMIDFILKHKE